jgi:O-antigen ligase
MSRATSFGEAHNDHLEIAAETGVVGYLLYLAALSMAAAPSLQKPSTNPRAQFARLAALPVVTVLFISSLAHFPLQLAASTTIFVCTFGLTNAWSAGDEV